MPRLTLFLPCVLLTALGVLAVKFLAFPDQTVRHGRIGTEGRSKTERFADEAADLPHAEGLIKGNFDEGYVDAA